VRERIWTAATVMAWLLFCLAAYTTPLFTAQAGSPVFGFAISLQVVSIMAAAGILIAVLFAATKAVWSPAVRWGFFIAGAGTLIALWRLNQHGPVAMALLALALVAVALPIGYWLGSQMQRVSHLIPLGIAMSMADIYSVFQGPSKRIAAGLTAYQDDVARKAAEAAQALPPEQASQAAAQAVSSVKAPLLTYFLVHVPLAGQQSTAPAIGIGDLIALAFIFRAVWVHGISPSLAFMTAFTSTLAAMTVAQLTQMPIPALPLICIGMLSAFAISDARLRRLDRQEILLSIGVVLLFGALLAAKWIVK
jgi:hypothetical protein